MRANCLTRTLFTATVSAPTVPDSAIPGCREFGSRVNDQAVRDRPARWSDTQHDILSFIVLELQWRTPCLSRFAKRSVLFGFGGRLDLGIPIGRGRSSCVADRLAAIELFPQLMVLTIGFRIHLTVTDVLQIPGAVVPTVEDVQIIPVYPRQILRETRIRIQPAAITHEMPQSRTGNQEAPLLEAKPTIPHRLLETCPTPEHYKVTWRRLGNLFNHCLS